MGSTDAVSKMVVKWERAEKTQQLTGGGERRLRMGERG